MKVESSNKFNIQKTENSIVSVKNNPDNKPITPAFGSRPGLLNYYVAKYNLKLIMRDDFKNPLKAIWRKQMGIGEFLKNYGNYENFAQAKGYEYAHEHKWTAQDLTRVEGLQYNLPMLKNMNMKQINVILDSIHHKNLFYPVIRGCNHRCSYCFLDANAPIKRISFEDFKQTIDDLSEMTKRMLYKTDNRPNKKAASFLFYDSDGSQVFLKDKDGKIHEFPELNAMIYDLTGTRGIFDTAGWNPKSKEIQARMERMVNYYCDNKRELNKISSFNLSINPFEGLYDKATQYKNKGNIEGFERLKKLYIDMVVNMLTTFTPLIRNKNVKILCRAYPDSVVSRAYDGYKHSDALKLRQEIIEKYLEKNTDNCEYDNNIQDIIERIFVVNSNIIGKGGRNNTFKTFMDQAEANSWDEYWKQKNKKVNALKQQMALVDINGKIYLGNDFYLCGTDLQLDYQNPIEKKLRISVLPEIINFK
ncbi:hypothetical protein J6E39_00745 [bacterium]|nr:hypothetical protein [bacterium]